MKKKIIEYAEIMEKKEMFQKYGISNSDIKIIYESAIGVGKYKWAEDFIERNINNIDFLHRDSIYNFGLAKIFFFQKNYSASRKHLIKVPYEDFVHYVDAKLIEARIDYEERCFVEIFGIIDSVKKYLKSHKEISDLYKQTYLTFANFLSRLVKLYEASETLSTIDYDIKKLKDDIDSYPKLLYGDSWLKEKIKEIEKGRH